MAKSMFRTEGLQEIPSFTIKETNDCVSAVANAIAIGIKQDSSINDVEHYVTHWCIGNSIPDDVHNHMLAVVSRTLSSLGYE